MLGTNLQNYNYLIRIFCSKHVNNLNDKIGTQESTTVPLSPTDKEILPCDSTSHDDRPVQG